MPPPPRPPWPPLPPGMRAYSGEDGSTCDSTMASDLPMQAPHYYYHPGAPMMYMAPSMPGNGYRPSAAGWPPGWSPAVDRARAGGSWTVSGAAGTEPPAWPQARPPSLPTAIAAAAAVGAATAAGGAPPMPRAPALDRWPGALSLSSVRRPPSSSSVYSARPAMPMFSGEIHMADATAAAPVLLRPPPPLVSAVVARENVSLRRARPMPATASTGDLPVDQPVIAPVVAEESKPATPRQPAKRSRLEAPLAQTPAPTPVATTVMNGVAVKTEGVAGRPSDKAALTTEPNYCEAVMTNVTTVDAATVGEYDDDVLDLDAVGILDVPPTEELPAKRRRKAKVRWEPQDTPSHRAARMPAAPAAVPPPPPPPPPITAWPEAARLRRPRTTTQYGIPAKEARLPEDAEVRATVLMEGFHMPVSLTSLHPLVYFLRSSAVRSLRRPGQ